MKLFINKLIKTSFNNEKYKYEKINFRGGAGFNTKQY